MVTVGEMPATVPPCAADMAAVTRTLKVCAGSLTRSSAMATVKVLAVVPSVAAKLTLPVRLVKSSATAVPVLPSTTVQLSVASAVKAASGATQKVTVSPSSNSAPRAAGAAQSVAAATVTASERAAAGLALMVTDSLAVGPPKFTRARWAAVKVAGASPVCAPASVMRKVKVSSGSAWASTLMTMAWPKFTMALAVVVAGRVMRPPLGSW